MSDSGHGLQIVSVTDNHSFVLDEDALKRLLLREDVKDLPVVVVSVAGAYRGGKSFLLNFFLRYLSSPIFKESKQLDGTWLGEESAPLVGFKWRSGIKATTMGILMWSEPFITSLPSGEKVAILVVDTQGTFDNKSTVRENSTVFALSTLLSSIQIYNLSHDIKEDDLQHLELFTEYGKLVNSGESNQKAFQVLEFLVRDWQFPDDYPYGMVGGERLLEEKLEINEGLAEEMKNLRYHIRSSFEKVSCFLMPHPGFAVLERTFKGNINEISPKFRAQLIDLISSIFGTEKLLPKTINGEKIKARDLFNYFKAYMELFNSDKIPTPGNILEMTVKAGLLSAVSEARDIYEKGMDAECGPKQLSVTPADLDLLHKQYHKLATDTFIKKKKMGSKKDADKYLNKLIMELDERLPQFQQSNMSKIQTAINKAREAYDAAIKNISKSELLCVHPVDLEKVHKIGVDAATQVYDAARKKISQTNDEDRVKFIQSFEKQYDWLRRINEQNNNVIVSNLKTEYWQNILPKTNLNPPLSNSQLKKEHDVELNKALEEFKSKRNIPSNYSEDIHVFNLAKGIQDYFIQLTAVNKSKNKLAIHTAIEGYEKYVRDNWKVATECIHPDDLDIIHRQGMCNAMGALRQQAVCSVGFNKDDEDENTLKSIIDQRYTDFKKMNDDANQTAILTAYNGYVGAIEDQCKFSVWWIFGLGVPYLVNLAKRKKFHNEFKSQAISKFYSKRRNDNNQQNDPYKERLIQMIEDYFAHLAKL